MRYLFISMLLFTALLTSGCIDAYNSYARDRYMNDPEKIRETIEKQKRQKKAIDQALGRKTIDPEELKLSVADYEVKPEDRESVDTQIKATNFRVGVVPFTSTSQSHEFAASQLKELERYSVEALSDIVSQKMQVTLYTRNDINKVFNEQRLQQTGDFSVETGVEIGRLVGLTHIITGNINNIETRVGNMAKFAGGATQQNFTTEQAAALSAVFNRLNAKAYITIKMIDVQTGRVLFHKNYTGTASTPGDTGNFRQEHYFSTTKDAIKDAVASTEFDLAKQFPTSSRVIQTRGGKSIALVGVGTSSGVNAGDTFEIMQIENVNGTESKFRVATLTISDQISDNQAWGFIEGNKKLVKIGMPALRVIKKQVDPFSQITGQFK